MFKPAHMVYVMLVSRDPPANQVQPNGLVIFTQKGIPVQTGQPVPESRKVHVRNVAASQSYHQITSASPEQTAARNCDELVMEGSSSGMETIFSPGQRLNKNSGVGVDVTVAVGVTVGVSVGVFVEGGGAVLPGLRVFVGIHVFVLVGVTVRVFVGVAVKVNVNRHLKSCFETAVRQVFILNRTNNGESLLQTKINVCKLRFWIYR